jgi:hypothetical protein
MNNAKIFLICANLCHLRAFPLLRSYALTFLRSSIYIVSKKAHLCNLIYALNLQ